MKPFRDIGVPKKVCPDCGKPVPPPQHSLLPQAERCLPCGQEHERQVEAAWRAFA
jgi:RNA polymerase-binding transcription factor DksA